MLRRRGGGGAAHERSASRAMRVHFRFLLHIVCARARQGRREDRLDTAGMRRHHDDAVGQINRFESKQQNQRVARLAFRHDRCTHRKN